MCFNFLITKNESDRIIISEHIEHVLLIVFFLNYAGGNTLKIPETFIHDVIFL